MAFNAEQFKKFMEQFEISQKNLIENLVNRLHIQDKSALVSDKSDVNVESIACNISEFIYDPENGHTFEAWFKRYEDLFRIDCSQLDDAARVRMLLRKLNTLMHERYTNFLLPKHPRDFTFDETVQKLTEMFGSQKTLFNTRYKCLKLDKQSDDDFIKYASIVNRECENFKLSTLTEDQFKCLVFVCGLRSPNDCDIRTRILSKLETDKNITLQGVAEECRRLVNLKHDTALVEHTKPTFSSHSVNAVYDQKSKQKQGKNKSNINHKKQREHELSKSPSYPCWYCGAMHFVKDCTFSNYKCKQCGNLGHKEGYCNSRRPLHYKKFICKKNFFGKTKPTQPQLQTVYAISNVNLPKRRKFVNLFINGHSTKLQLDTGSDITIISEDTWRSIGEPNVNPTTFSAQNASGDQVKLLGQISCTFSIQCRESSGICYLTNVPNLNLLGLDWLDKLQLWDTPFSFICNALTSQSVPNESFSKSFLDDLRKQYPQVFSDGLGHCTEVKAKLQLCPYAKPVFRPKRPVTYAALADVDCELNRLEQEGVLKHVIYSNWAAPIVVVKKPNGSVRICADFSTGLNAALELHQYPLPLPDDIFATLNGGKIFSQLDFADAYLQVEVDESSRELLTINTHRGLYQYTRLPFGVKSAPGIFQQIMDTMLAGVDGAFAYLDDIILVSSSVEEHTELLQTVFQRIEKFGFRIRLEKCHFFLTCIKYLGVIIDQNGRRPDPMKIEAIQRMPSPTNISELRSLLGLVNYYGQFVPSLTNLRSSLDMLLKKNIQWNWSRKCQTAFEEIKTILSSDLLLTHYDPYQTIIVAADASNYGIGAVISHRMRDGTEKAISHASRSLTPAERNYGQIEKEALALIFAVKKFHKMLHGRKFTLLTDHKPLLAIFGSKKGIPVYSASRLQRWATILLAYNFDIEYRSTHDFGQADALSRLISDQQITNDDDVVIGSISVDNEVERIFNDSVRFLPVTATMIKDATVKDKLLQNVIHYLQNGWPTNIINQNLQQFYRRRSSLSIFEGCLMFGDRVVVPNILQNKVLRQLHYGHPGIVRMKALSRSYVYWPNLDAQIEDLVHRCIRCASVAKAPTKCVPNAWPTPKKPWSRIHIDFAGPFQQHNFLVVVDAYSKWPEIFIVPNTTTSTTILILQELFARFGMPETIVSDNATQFTSQKFVEFCSRNGITIKHSPPYHPQSNGQAERFVDTFKRALLKMKGEETTKEVLHIFLQCYRSTPNRSLQNNITPAEAFLGRPIRTPLELIKPTHPSLDKNENNVVKDKFRKFEPGDLVYLRNYRGTERWLPGKVIGRRGKVMYEVQVQSMTWIRHINQLRRRYISSQATCEEIILPLNLLLDTYNLLSVPVEQNSLSEVSTNVSEGNSSVRRSTRTRPPVHRLKVNPKNSSYKSD